MEYREIGGAVEPIRVHTLVISVHHAPGVLLEQMRKELMEKVVKEVVPAKYLDENTVYHLLPSKAFLEGGPKVLLPVAVSPAPRMKFLPGLI